LHPIHIEPTFIVVLRGLYLVFMESLITKDRQKRRLQYVTAGLVVGLSTIPFIYSTDVVNTVGLAVVLAMLWGT